MTQPILSVNNVSKTFHLGNHKVKALTNVSLDVAEGECLAIVGESGSGKSTLANIILGIYPGCEGEVLFNGERLPTRRNLEHRRMIQLVQQNPMSSLNPRRSIGASLRLPLDVHQLGSARERDTQVKVLLAEVGLDEDFAMRSPASLSGGQRQRVAIARALACDSKLVVLDEPTSALDVLVQARVLCLLAELKQRRNLSFLFITHDLSVVRNVADRVAVFKQGSLVELAATSQVFTRPAHAYTQQLIAAVPVVTEAEQLLRNKLSNMENSYV
ncbi:MAG TPA: ABC transporter ATP-binding protein [Oceanospirillaceae bacterium]|nr:ABC transporter ATP-binding protein [Oceanospirillaceae bacterium]